MVYFRELSKMVKSAKVCSFEPHMVVIVALETCKVHKLKCAHNITIIKVLIIILFYYVCESPPIVTRGQHISIAS